MVKKGVSLINDFIIISMSPTDVGLLIGFIWPVADYN